VELTNRNNCPFYYPKRVTIDKNYKF